MKMSDIEIVGSVDPSAMPPPRRPGGAERQVSPITQRIVDDAAAGRVTVLRLPKGSRSTMANSAVQGGTYKTLKRRGFKVNTSTRLDDDGTLLLYVHCTPIDQNGHQS